jgi:hypothetical protein
MPAGNQYGKFPDNSSAGILGRLEGRRFINEKTGCWEWLGSRNPKGYGMISIKGQMVTVHRLMAELCLNFDSRNKKDHVRHSCDNPACFNPDHLLVGDCNDNVQDRFDRNNWGGIAKLAPEVIEEIKVKYSDGVSQYDLAKEYDVNQSTINRVVTGQRWSRLPSSKEGVV